MAGAVNAIPMKPMRAPSAEASEAQFRSSKFGEKAAGG